MAKKVDSIIRSMKKNGYTEPEVADDWEDRFQYDYQGVPKEERLERLRKLTESADASYAAYKAQQAQNEADKATGLYQYNHATDDQKSALDNIYTAQYTKPTGYERFTGTAQNATKMADDFKATYGVDDDAYNTLMNGYKAYRSGQAANALASYNDISDEQKKALEKIRSLKTDGTANNTTLSGGDRYSGYKTDKRNAAGTIAQNFVNLISGKTAENNAEASRLKDEFKQKYGVDDSTYSVWQAKYDEDQTARAEESAAHKEGVRTQSQEMEYANKTFKNFTSKDTGDGSSWNDRTNALKQEIYDYLDQEDATQTSEAMQYAESASNVNSTLQKQKLQLERTKASIKSKYNLSDEDFEDLKYYGQELYDAENRKKQQQEAYDNVHTGSTLKNVAGGIKNSAAALVTNPYGGLGAIGETLKYNHGGYRDSQSPINVNSNAFAATNATSDYQSATQSAISDKNKLAGLIYGAGMSAAESAETGILGGSVDGTGKLARVARDALSLAPFAANAYGNSLSENVSNDQRQSKAFENALTSATIETVTEIASADKFWDIFKNHNATARKRIIDFLVSSGIEGSEEVVGDIADNFMDAVVNGQSSDYNKNVRSYMMSGMSEEEAKEQATKDSVANTAESFVSGALSGAMGAGIATAAGYANDVTTANNLFDNYTSEDYAEWADGLDTDPASYRNESVAQSAQKAKELATKMSGEETPSKKEKLQLYEYYQDIVDTENEALAEEQDNAKWNEFKGKVKNALGLNKTTTEQTTTDSAQESISDVSNVPEEYRSEKNNTSYNDAYKAIQSATTQDELNEAIQTAKNSEEISWEDYEKLEQTAGSYAASKNNLDLEQAKISTEDAYTAGYSGHEIGAVSPALQIAYNDGVQQAASDRAEQKAMNEEAVQKAAAKQRDDGLRTIIESNYQDGMNASTYNTVMASAINAGRTGMTFEDYAQENGASLAVVGEDIAKTAFKAGQKVAISDALKEAARSLGEKTNVKSYGIGSYTDARTDNKESINGEGVFKAVAQMTGLNIVLTDDGFGDNDNGYYQSSNSTIYINANQADRMASALFHEVGEFASVWNQKEYASVVNDIMQASQKALGSREFNRLRQKYANAYQGETNKTDADIDKEMANDLLYQFLGNEQGMTKLMDQIDQNHGYKEAKSIKQRLADWIGKMVDSIKNFLSELQPNSYQRKMAEATLQNYEALQDSIVKSIANAEKNYSDARAAAAETRAIEQGKGSIEDYGVENESSGEKRLSIETYEHGGREYLENFLDNTDDLTEEQKDDILDHMEWAYNLAKDLAKSNQYEYFGQWSQTALAKSKDGVPLIEVRTASDSKPIRSVAVNNGEYPLNIDFSQVCKKRSTLNAVLNYMVKNYGMNLRTLTASDVININQAIKNHGFEIACGLCFVDAKRYRTGAWASTFTEGTRNKKGELNTNQPGYNNLVRMIRPKDGSDVGYSYFNFATSIPTESARTIDQLSDDELDLSRLQRKLGRYAKYDENGNLIGIGGYKDNAGKTKNPTETIRLAWAIYSNPEMRHLISEEDLISSDGLDAMRDQNSMLYSLVNAHWGAGKPKLSHGGTAYGNEILRSTEWGSKNDFNPESAAKVGGVRVQSFSDYEANMFFDYMQLFADMSARQLTSHGYTKEPYYAKLFGMTGQKINLSVVAKAAELTADQQARYEKLVNKGDKYLMEDPEFKEIAEHAGLGKDENGNWTRLLVEDETFPLQEALDLQKDPRYNSNCGIIWIGVSDAQIRVLLDSNDVPMVIPYHSSGVSRIVKKARNLLLYTDYTNKQNTRTKDGKKITGKDFDFYGSLAKTNDVITTTNEYLAWCNEHNYLPKFDQFADHPNYYKLLIDFRAYDYNGIDPEKMAHRVYQPQQKITMNFPENFSDLVAASLTEQQATKDLEAKEFTDAQGTLLNDVKDVLGLNDDGSRAAGESVRRSLVVDDGVNMDDIDDFVDTVMANNGQSGRKYNQVTIKELNETDIENIRKATGGRVNATGKHFAIEGGKLFHEIRRHSDPSNNWYSWQLTYDQNDVPDIIETMLHPDKIEDLDNVYPEDQRDNLAFVKKQNGSYVIVVAVGGKRNKAITPEMILRFETEELEKKLQNGTIAEFLYEEAAKNLSDEKIDSIKKNRVTAGSHEPRGSFSLTSETILRSPLFEKNVAQDQAAGKRNSLNIDSDDNALTESQQKYFENSKVRDDDGRLLVMYHGTEADFNVFDRQYIGMHGRFEGYGFNFTPSKDRANGYSNGRVLKGYLNVTNPLSDSKITMTTREFANLIMEADPTGDDIIANYARDTMDYGTPAFVKREAMTTAKLIMESAQSDVDLYSELSAAGGDENLIDLFKKKGYDGLIHHYDDGKIKTVITFDSNQFKNTDNQYPTQAADIRRAVGIDEFDFAEFGDPLLNDLTEDELREWIANSGMQEPETNDSTDLISALRSSNEVLKGGKVNKADVRRIARQIKSQYGSNINVDTLAENLAKIFDYAQNRDYINYEDLATVIAEVAAPVIDGSVNKVGAEEFNSFKDELRGYTFKLDERQENEVIRAFGSWGAFRKQLPGIKFVRGDKSGIALDSVWDTLCQESGYVLDNMVTSNDMPLALVDAYNSMRPTYQNAFGEDAERATEDAAMEIVSKYYQYAADQEKAELKTQQRQRLIDQSKMLKKRNEETRKKLKQQYNERLEKEVAKLRQEGKPEKVSVQVARLRARNAKTVASLRENQKRKEQLKTLNRNAAKLVEWVSNPTDKNHIPKMLQTPVLELVAAMDFVPQTVRETADGKYSIRLLESRHVNEDGSYSYTWKTITADTVQDAVAAYKKAMNDFGLGSASNKKWQDRMQTIQDLYQQSEEDDWFEKSELKQGLDKELGIQLGEILKNNRGMFSIAELSSSELQTVNDVIRNVMHAVNQMNRMYSQPSQKVADVAHEVMDRAYNQKAKGRGAHGKMGNIFLDTFTLDHATPETFFHGLFGGKETDPITKTMIKAQNQKARDIRQAQEYMKEYMTDDVKKVVKDWMYDAHSKDHNTRNFYGMELTTTQVMSLYELMKRPDAQQHKVGGFVVDETGRKSDGRHKVIHLTDEQITSITDTLSEEQKKIADAMQYYMAHQCAEQGNETAMQLYGYDKYLDEHYFPMATDKNTIATKDSNVTTGAVNAIKNSGFTKKITPNATNPLILKDIFNVFSDHVSDMATYHSWAAPLQDILRFYNYNEKTSENEFITRRSTKDAFDYFYGNGGQQYMTRLLSSINQMEKSNFVGGKFMEMMTGNAKAAAVMGNIRVVVQQPTAFFRAGEMISYKYLSDGFTGKYAKEAADLRDRTSDVFWLKNQGNIDGYITQGMVSTITGVQTAKEKINEKAGSLAGKADEATWAAMYRAVYAEQVDKLGKSKIGTEEFENAVNDRFSEIMLRTQVYDGTITRSQFMRSTDWYNKMKSAFMAEPVKTYNIVLRHAIDLMQADNPKAVAEAKRGFRRAAGVLTLTNVVNAVVQSLWDAFRNAGDVDDEDKDFLQRFLDALGLGFLLDEDADAVSSIMGGNFADNMDLLSNIPLVADYWDAIKSGFSSAVLGESSYSSDNDLSMSAVNNFFKAVKAIVNPSEKMTNYGRFAAIAREFSDLTGIPVYAVQRDAVAIYNVLAKDIANGLAGADLPVLQKNSKYTKTQQAKLDVYTEALEGGDFKAAIENAYNAGNSYESIRNSIKTMCKDEYLELKKTNPSEAAQMKNRIAQMYAYIAEQTGTYKDKTNSEKVEQYKKNIDEWTASEE